MTYEEIAELITRRRRQILVNSVIFFRFDYSFVSDRQMREWCRELDYLQHRYPHIAARQPFAEEFMDIHRKDGYDELITNSWARGKARQIVDYEESLIEKRRPKRKGFN